MLAVRSGGDMEAYMDQIEADILADQEDKTRPSLDHQAAAQSNNGIFDFDALDRVEGKEHLTTTESSNIAAETSHGEDPGDISDAQIDDNNSKGVEEHLTKTESSNIAAETSHGEDPGDISLAEIDKRDPTATEETCYCLIYTSELDQEQFEATRSYFGNAYTDFQTCKNAWKRVMNNEKEKELLREEGKWIAIDKPSECLAGPQTAYVKAVKTTGGETAREKIKQQCEEEGVTKKLTAVHELTDPWFKFAHGASKLFD